MAEAIVRKLEKKIKSSKQNRFSQATHFKTQIYAEGGLANHYW